MCIYIYMYLTYDGMRLTPRTKKHMKLTMQNWTHTVLMQWGDNDSFQSMSPELLGLGLGFFKGGKNASLGG